MIKVVTNSVADLPRHIVGEYGIFVVSGLMDFQGEHLPDDYRLSASDLYEKLRANNSLPVRIEPTIEQFKVAYEGTLAQDPRVEILSIHQSGEMSDTVQRARVAAGAFPERSITVFDTQSLSLGEGLMVHEAAQMIRNHRDIAAILPVLETMRAAMHGYLALDTLKYLRQMGQVGQVEGLLGSLFSGKPILMVKEGQIAPHDGRGLQEAQIAFLKETAIQYAWGISNLRLGIAHTAADDQAHALAAELAEQLKPETLLLSEFGAANGVYGGEGSLAVFWCVIRR